MGDTSSGTGRHHPGCRDRSPPDAALADVSGSVRYFDCDAAEIARLVRVRMLALYGLDCAVGVAPNPMLARMAGSTDRLVPFAVSRIPHREYPAS
ncbi:hypothetical protein ACIA8I_32000 [Streptomyces rishiriensis]|uniref:Y-family DNA polymerase n=1 Tax=Streptomyces rishiriensis TaxID=68264 RepID=UPI0037A133CA